MTTRLYLPISGTPPLASLAVNSNWEYSTSLARLPSFTARSNTALITYTYQPPTASGTYQWVWRQWQSDILKYAYSWTTADTVSMVIGKCAETTTGGDAHLAYVVRVVSGDGSVIRGVIGLMHATSSEFPLVAAAATRIHNALTTGATNFSSQAGDRIIVEIGLHLVTPVVQNMQMRFGDPTANPPADFALTAGLTTDLVPWVQLSRTVEFGNPPLVIQDVTQAQATENTALIAHSFLTAADMIQAQAVDNLALIAHSLLAVGDITQAQTVDNLTFTYHEGISSTPLVIQDCTQAQVTEEPSLTAHSFLSVADMAQEQNTDNQALLVHSFLAINNVTQAQSTDGISLSAHSFLAVANVEQAQAVDGLSLTARSSLDIADISQGQSTETPALITHSFLNIANVSQDQATDSVALVSRSSLAVDNLSQAQVTDAPILLAHSFLAIADATQGQVTENVILAYHPAGSMVLLIQDIEQGQIIDQPVLVSHSFLSVANMLQEQVAENMALVYHPSAQPPPGPDTFRGMYLGEFLHMKRQ